jgi:two-component system alkaline phosphatase synthesis response regulator PhoP
MPIDGSLIMLRLLIIARESETLAELKKGLVQNGFACSFASNDSEILERVSRQPPDLVMVEIGNPSPDFKIWEVIQGIKQQRHLPVMALVSEEMLDSVDGHHGLDDFLTSPYSIKELVLRINRLLSRTRGIENNELIRCDGLMIDLARCEVTVDGRQVELTFKEYELLKYLAGNKGRVHTRETLLNRVWGYDYYGGDRTVDVHVRRLRSKIEDSRHSYIETVRNVGYRFTINNHCPQL